MIVSNLNSLTPSCEVEWLVYGGAWRGVWRLGRYYPPRDTLLVVLQWRASLSTSISFTRLPTSLMFSLTNCERDSSMTKKLDWKPWYRRKDYKGNLTEDQKRYLDSFRNGKPHPATSFNDLPEEVQERLTELECEVKEYQSNQAMLTMIAWITLGGYLCYRGYTSETLFGSASSYIVALGMFVMFYRFLKLIIPSRSNSTVMVTLQ